MSLWTYAYKSFTPEDVPDGAVGFVYLITNHHSNKFYIGKKLFTKSKTYQKNKKRKKKRVSSDWESYWGSNDALKEDVKTLGEQNFTRTILRICFSKSELNYFETKEIFSRDALLREEYYNSWVSARINGNTLINIRI